MSSPVALSMDVLKIDAAQTAAAIETSIREIVFKNLKRKGAVVAISGGIDSSVVAALCARALGEQRVLGLFLPESESSGDSLRLGKELAKFLGIDAVTEDITPLLKAAGCYRRRDEAIRQLIPEYNESYKCKIVLPGAASGVGYAIFSIVVQSPKGKVIKERLSPEAYYTIVAATNFKQRTRKMMEYYHADRLSYAVAGTPNRLEYDQGFFVKNGDGAADLKPVAHLYKTQVYQLAKYLNIPEEIQKRPSTTDTYSMPQSQEEFYFTLPNEQMDLCLYGKNHGIEAAEVASCLKLPPEVVERAYHTIDAKRKATRYLHLPPVLVEEVSELGL